jgi:hypothetical protein
MNRDRPSYIPAELSALPVEYKWDDWDPYSVLPEASEATESTFEKTSDRAAIAYAIACAEWTVFRLEPFLDGDNRPFKYLEACWAVEMSDAYGSPPESNAEEWEGAVRGAVDLSLMTVLNTIYTAEDGEAYVQAAFAEVLAAHVVQHHPSFTAWSEKARKRLLELYPRDSDEPMGDPVPRQALDPAIPLETIKANTEQLVWEELQKATATDNPYLIALQKRH